MNTDDSKSIAEEAAETFAVRKAHIDKLRQRYPDRSPGFFLQMEEAAKLECELRALRGRLAYLAGYYDTAGAVPVAEIREAIGMKPEAVSS